MTHCHLDSRVAELVDRPIEERIGYILADKYIPYPLAEYLITEVQWILRQVPSQRPKCLLVYGDPGFGKSMILDEVRRRSDEARKDGSPRHHPMVTVTLSGSSELRILYARILRALDSPFSIDDKPASLYEQACVSLRAAKTLVLEIDELHNLLLARSQLEGAMAVLRDLSNLPLSLVCAGTAAARTCVSADAQLQDRFRCHHLTAWQETQETRNFVATLEARLPLREASGLTSKKMMQLLLKMSAGHPRTLVVGVREAARDALIGGDERITLERLQSTLTRILAEKYEAAV